MPLDNEHPLRKWADEVRGMYGHPVFLVGSQLTDKEDPRDVDVVCVLPDDSFERWFGPVDKWIEQGDTGQWTEVRWGWARHCVDRWSIGCKTTGLNLDFKIIPQRHHNETYMDKPRYRLDTGDI